MSAIKPAVFTRDNPCTKVELHNCFYKQGLYRPRPVVEAKAEIGENAPKYLLREGYVVVRHINNVDYYCPTPEGDNWLRQGIMRYLQLHPDRLLDLREKPIGLEIHTRKKPPAKTAPVKRIIRRTR